MAVQSCQRVVSQINNDGCWDCLQCDKPVFYGQGFDVSLCPERSHSHCLDCAKKNIRGSEYTCQIDGCGAKLNAVDDLATNSPAGEEYDNKLQQWIADGVGIPYGGHIIALHVVTETVQDLQKQSRERKNLKIKQLESQRNDIYRQFVETSDKVNKLLEEDVDSDAPTMMQIITDNGLYELKCEVKSKLSRIFKFYKNRKSGNIIDLTNDNQALVNNNTRKRNNNNNNNSNVNLNNNNNNNNSRNTATKNKSKKNMQNNVNNIDDNSSVVTRYTLSLSSDGSSDSDIEKSNSKSNSNSNKNKNTNTNTNTNTNKNKNTNTNKNKNKNEIKNSQNSQNRKNNNKNQSNKNNNQSLRSGNNKKSKNNIKMKGKSDSSESESESDNNNNNNSSNRNKTNKLRQKNNNNDNSNLSKSDLESEKESSIAQDMNQVQMERERKLRDIQRQQQKQQDLARKARTNPYGGVRGTTGRMTTTTRARAPRPVIAIRANQSAAMPRINTHGASGRMTHRTAAATRMNDDNDDDDDSDESMTNNNDALQSIDFDSDNDTVDDFREAMRLR